MTEALRGGEMNWQPKCAICGKFCRPVAWKMIYSGAIPMPDHEIFMCSRCYVETDGFTPQHGIKPEFSCGILPAPILT